MGLVDQVRTLMELDYPGRMGLSRSSFRELMDPLLEIAPTDAGRVVIVVPETMIDVEALVPTLHLVGSRKPGVLDRNHGPDGLRDYRPSVQLSVPDALYLLTDVRPGVEFCGVRPVDALAEIDRLGRTPLTIAEGIALHTHFPELLRKNECYMLGGSSRGDKRVPGLWISQGAPKLGWCWQGNPHSWLGMASASARRSAAG